MSKAAVPVTGATTIIAGATGKLGQLIVRRLAALKQPVRILTRRPDAARRLFGESVQIAVGDFGDRTSLDTAVRDGARLLLLSPISARLVTDQISAVDAAVAAGVRRIVKISGSDWTIDPPGHSISGDAHAAVERHLNSLALDTVSLRPNAWMQVSLANTVRQAIATDKVAAANPDAGVGYIDARDIADVAVDQLLADTVTGRTLNLTGPDIVSARQLADLLSTTLKRRFAVVEKPPLAASGDADFEHRAIAQFARLIAAGRAATTTDVVKSLLGRPPRSVAAFISEHAAAEAALTE
ncbi:NmrA family protein [Ensifer sp. NM-2]|uniref:NmrA family NAD(P)-binding protein n=1 Tax=Ensifer sp. NM-2 TaxID=2109730 RepID=UPI000D12F625|nr:NmrA family NAD(P)-binding protein [Ensifer sp. NM-2]PSS59925.1 NmrA family protein [Ensifer sp. NM-2]